ncbi:hypothetical protein R1flu_024381 [Riccia fluitans]|uniref:Ribosomal RNA small subunit methyltransferase G n=1 Tax=Riccia fluitans TaxID=41844 RepID=A0ABD1XV76_9MARC
MVLLYPSVRCLGLWPHLIRMQPKGCRFGRNQWLEYRRKVCDASSARSVNNAVRETLDRKQLTQVSEYIDSLLDWNQRMDLTAVTERDAVMERHIMDSLALLPVLEAAYGENSSTTTTTTEQLNIIDVGTGAGLPGIVFAIARPAWQITLLESLQKRCNFLDYAVKKSGLSNVEVVRARAEDGGQDKMHREKYDVAVARAVAEMRVLSELCLPFVRVGGIFVAAKGPNPLEEVELSKKAVHLLGASILSISNVDSTGPLESAPMIFRELLIGGDHGSTSRLLLGPPGTLFSLGPSR